MNHHTTSHFRTCYERLPASVRGAADRRFELLKQNPGHPSLQFKPVGQYWSVRVTLTYRAPAIRRGEEVTWFWIGHHGPYDRILKQP